MINRNARHIGVVYPNDRMLKDVEEGNSGYILLHDHVARLGCQLEVSWTAWGDEYGCGHGYTWDCEACPTMCTRDDARDETREKQNKMYREY